jgi:hypothetical protein
LSLVATSTRDYLFSVTITVVLIVFFLAGWSGLVGKTKIVLITIYTASSFFYKYFRVFLSLLVTSPDYFIRGRAKVYGIPAIRYSK